MKITITLETDNDAFSSGNKRAEVARILREVYWTARDEWRDLDGKKLRDINGNTVGTVEVSE